MELIANYVDFYSVQSMSAVLRWCDTAGTFVLQAVDRPARQQLLEQWSRYAVMRSIKIELYVHGLEWETRICFILSVQIVKVFAS